MATVTINSEDLDVLAVAASHWCNELYNYIIPASYDAEDRESAESQECEAQEIQDVLAWAHPTEN